MSFRNPHFDINKLSVISAILVLLGDFISLLVAIQNYCDELEKREHEARISFEERQRLDSQRFRLGITRD